MNYHRLHSITGLMRALESGFALGRLVLTCPTRPYLAWIRLSPDSDTWEIEYGSITACGLAMHMEDLIRHPWKWHIGLVSDGSYADDTKGHFGVTFEDTLPWILGE